MSRTVNEGFNEFVEGLIPPFSEPGSAATNLRIIERCLKSGFDMDYLVTYGSIGHGTNVDGYCAIDCFAVIDKSRLHEESNKSLAEIRDCLAGHFPDAIVTDGRPCISISFGDNPCDRHHVVPAFPSGKQGDHYFYGIPGPSDQWIEASPGGHSAWINSLNDESKNKLKPFVRAIKAWNFYNGKPLWSFYVELCAAEFLKERNPIVYSSDVASFLTELARNCLEPVEQPASCNEPVYGTSRADRKNALNAVRVAADLARQAHACEVKGNIADAYYFWRKLYSWRFPSYLGQAQPRAREDRVKESGE